jgi:hypothetical protein
VYNLCRVKCALTGSGPTFKDFIKVHFEGDDDMASIEYFQVRGIFRAVFEDDQQNGIYFFGRWCERLDEVDWTLTQLLAWEKPPESKMVYKDWYLDFVSGESVLEPCTVIPKPFRENPEADMFDINDSARIMWVHSRGKTSYGET